MSNFKKSTKPKDLRLYGSFIKTLRIIQALGFVVVILTAIWLGALATAAEYMNYARGVVVAMITAVVGMFSVYLSTQGFIAIIDLLSRIEYNTRHSPQVKYPA